MTTSLYFNISIVKKYIADSFVLPNPQSRLRPDLNCLLALLPPNILIIPKHSLVQIYLPDTILVVFPNYVCGLF